MPLRTVINEKVTWQRMVSKFPQRGLFVEHLEKKSKAQKPRRADQGSGKFSLKRVFGYVNVHKIFLILIGEGSPNAKSSTCIGV